MTVMTVSSDLSEIRHLNLTTTPGVNSVLDMELRTDNYGVETRWELVDTTGNYYIAETVFGTSSSDKIYVEEVCMS